METKRDSFFLSNKNDNKNKNKKQKQPGNTETFQRKRWNGFNKNRVGVEGTENGNHKEAKPEKPEKKPFDKKTYRLKKYSKKYKLEQWEEQRKKKLMHEYQKTVKKESLAGQYKPISFDEDTVDSHQPGKFVRHPDLIEKENSAEQKQQNRDPFQKAKEQFNKIKQDKLTKQEEIQKAKEERQKKIEEYKRKKQERFKKLSKKTKKGQPVMTGRLELLLEKLQKEK